MKAMLISGSPRKNGNTMTILSAIERGLSDHGFVTKCIVLSDSNIQYCVGCKFCYKTGICVLNDDVASIVKEIFDAQLVIVASPSYWGDVTAQLKTFIDRCTPFCDTNAERKLAATNTKGVAVAVRAGMNKAENENLVNTIEHFLGHLNIPMISSFTVEGINTTDDLVKRLDVLEDAYDFGKSLVV